MAPDQGRFRDTRGQILAKMGRWKEALADLEAALPSAPRSTELHRTLAEVYTHLGVPGMAAEHRALAEQKPVAAPAGAAARSPPFVSNASRPRPKFRSGQPPEGAMAIVQKAPPVASPRREPEVGAFPWRLVVVGGILFAAELPLLVQFAQQLWMRPHYQFFPLVLLGAAVLAYTRLRGLGPVRPGQPVLSGAFLALAWGLLALAEVLYSTWLAATAALVLLAALLYALGGGRLFRQALPAWLLLWTAVPPPLELDRNLILWLQSLTAGWSSAVLDFLGTYHVMAGNVVEINARRLLVEEACSGVNSLFSVLACTLFLVFLCRRPPVRACLLLAAAMAWVLTANVARVVGVVALATPGASI